MNIENLIEVNQKINEEQFLTKKIPLKQYSHFPHISI